MAIKIGLLVLLGFLWAARLAAIKAAGVSGIPVHVVVSVAACGIALFFTIYAIAKSAWMPIDRHAFAFYLVSGVAGFLAPFALENIVAPHIPVFVFVVIIATMPILTLLLSFITCNETPSWRPTVAICVGFLGAVGIILDATRADPTGQAGIWWIVIAFGVPTLYALNTVFIAHRWPARATAVQVAHAQAVIVAVAAVVGTLLAGAFADWQLVLLNPAAMGLIIVGEGLALLVYLRITRDFGATWVSLANYVSMIFAALIGVLIFDDQVTLMTSLAALGIVAAVTIHQWPVTAGDPHE